MAAMKAAYLSVLAGDSPTALVTGSETASKFMRAEFFEPESESKVEELRKNPALAFEHDFLRWMLSDGAGAVYLSDQPNPEGLSLKINWIEGRSYANEEPVCMLAGGSRDANGEIIPWKDLRLSDDTKAKKYALNVRQDIRQLKDMIALYSVEKPLSEIKKKRGLHPGDYAWFLPHYSSHYFRDILVNALAKIDMPIPSERWFTALYDKGNIGSASILVFIDELLKQRRLERGQKILGYIPESSRFSVYYFELEVV
jgi:3-oxoacyl-[acyl-carrier-protein] synthase-3